MLIQILSKLTYYHIIILCYVIDHSLVTRVTYNAVIYHAIHNDIKDDCTKLLKVD